MTKWRDNIKERRKELNMSQEELAKKVGYSGRSIISYIESGRSDVTVEKFREIADALHIDPVTLMGDGSTGVIMETTFEYTATDDLLERLKACYAELSYKDREALVKYAEFLTKEK